MMAKLFTQPCDAFTGGNIFCLIARGVAKREREMWRGFEHDATPKNFQRRVFRFDRRGKHETHERAISQAGGGFIRERFHRIGLVHARTKYASNGIDARESAAGGAPAS